MTSQVKDGKTEFRLYRPSAKSVWLAGDFNGWDPRRTPMHREATGHWTCALDLQPGSYEFRYVVDGNWIVDCASFGLHPGPFGWNSVVYVRTQLGAERSRQSAPSRAVEVVT